VFAARAVNLSPHGIALSSPVTARLSDRVIAEIDQFGKYEGRVIRLLQGGFVMSVLTSDAERAKLAARIEWFEKHKDHDATDQRADQRKVPACPYSQMMVPNSKTETCLVLDYSASGAAISAESIPAIGTVMAIGAVVARVVRHFEGGFGVQFVHKQNAGGIEKALIHFYRSDRAERG
jgi:hypothetical protein